ncbi:MAG: caspase family protein [Pseudomonadota bacterium]
MILRAFAILVLIFGLGAPAFAETRVALVIANARYASVADLANPANDASDVAAALERADFAVSRVSDADFDTMRRALAEFGGRAARSDVAVIYFAGHGLELNRQNYLMPVDADLREARDVAFHTVPLDLIREAARPAARLSLVIVDACRTNPFLASLPGEGRSLARGLARVATRGQNALVAFAAKEGTIAEDGAGRNSPYAASLVAALDEPGLEIGKLFRRVRDDVIRRTRGRQEPALYGSLSEEDFFFVPPAQAEDVAARGLALATPIRTAEPVTLAQTSTPPPAHAPGGAVDLAFWGAISNSRDPRDFEDYLSQFPNGTFAGIALRRLEQLQGTPSPEPAAVPAPEPVRPEPTPEPVVEPPRTVASAPVDPPQPSVPQPVIEPDFLPSRAQIRDSQARLTLLDYVPGPADGLMGRQTEKAISTFQRAEGLTSTGELTRATFDLLAARVPADRLAAFYRELEAQRVAARRAAEERRRLEEEEEAAAEAARRQQQEAAAAAARAPDPAAEEAAELDKLRRRCEWLDNNGNASRIRECIPFINPGTVISSGGDDTETGNPAERDTPSRPALSAGPDEHD